MEARTKNGKSKELDILSRKDRYQEIISVVTQSVHQSIDLQTVLDNSIEAMVNNIDNMDNVSIYLVEDDMAVIKAHHGYTKDYLNRAGRIPYPKGVTWKTIIEGKSRYVADAEQDKDIGQAGKDMGISCYLIVPLFDEDKVVGVIIIVSREKKNVFDEEELKLLEIVSKQISIAIRNAKQAQALSNSEERYRTLFQEGPSMYFTVSEDGTVLSVNRYAIEKLGYAEMELVGNSVYEVFLDEDVPKVEQQMMNCFTNPERIFKWDMRKVCKDGSIISVSELARCVIDNHGNKVAIIACEDTTEREKANTLLMAEKNILEMISQEKKLEEILEHICLTVEQQSDNMLCSFLLSDQDEKFLLSGAGPSLPKEYMEDTKKIPIGPNIGSCGTASYLKKQVIVSDIENDPLWKDYKHLALKHNLRACWSTPILSKDNELLGSFAMYYTHTKKPDGNEQDIIERATHLARIAIERKRYEETKEENLEALSKKSRYEEIISTVTRSVHQSIDLQTVLDNSIEAMVKDIDKMDNVSIYLVEGDEAVLKAHHGFTRDYLKRASRVKYPKGGIWRTIIDAKPRYCADTDTDDAIGQAGRDMGIKCYLVVPLFIEDKVVGTLTIVSREKDAFDEEERRLLETVSKQIAIAIRNAQHALELKISEETLKKNYKQLSKKNRYEEIISAVTSSVHRSIDLNEVLENAAESLSKNVDHADHVAIYLVEGDNAILKSYTGYPKWFIDIVKKIPKPKGFTWKTLLDGQPRFVGDATKDKAISPAGRKVGTKSYAAVPIKYNNTTIGCINISSRILHAFDEDEMKLLEIVANQIETAVNNASQAEALKISREELSESKEHFRLLVETTNVIPWEFDPKANKFTYVGPQVERLLGYPINDWYIENFWPSIIHDEDREQILETCFTATQALDDHEFEYRMISKSGEVIWIYEMVSVITEEGEPKTLRGFMIDITERKKVESAKREAEERYRTLIEHSYDIIVETNVNGTFLYINPTFCDVLGYERDELLGRSIFENIHEDDAPETIEQFSSAINKLKRGTATYRFKHKSDNWRWLESIASPFRLATGDMRTVISSRDITERMESENKLQNAFNEIEMLKNKLEKENVYLQKELELTTSHGGILGESRAIKSALSKIEQVAKTDSTVLLTGETGTGKELFANRIHSLSDRKDRVMVKVNCAALPPHLIESELFGHEKGAFTGAVTKSIGRFEVADDSTIFLDEVGELPLELQSKLLRVLQEGEFQRLGSAKTIKVNVRVITASNKELLEAVSQGKFREDLYYRLNVFPINIPPLRERKEDIPDLLWFFISEFEEKMDKTIKNISRKDMENLINYPWPGNVRQLRNIIERAMIISTGPDLIIDLPGISNETPIEMKPIEEVERDHISYILNMTNWRIRGKTGAAEILGLKPTTLESRIKKLGIKRGH